MNWRKHFIEGATLIVAAVVCALVSNAVASRERKLTLVASSERRAASGTKTAPAPVVPQPAVAPQPLPQPATVNRQPVTTTTRQPTTDNRQPTTDNRQPTTDNRQSVFRPHLDKPYIEIHGDDVASLHAKGVLFLDARRTSVYEQGHIPGARPFSVWESDIDEKVNKLYAERSDPKDQDLPIVIYCSGGDCEDSHMLAQKLWGIGFNNAYVYKDGFPDWQKRGEPIHTGPNP
jgi:rhodanese-related sulfurtransferase